MNPSTIHNEALERAMDAVARNDNPQTREPLYRAILASTLIFAGKVFGDSQSAGGHFVAGNDTRIAFGTIEHPPGHIVLPAFTELEAFAAFFDPGAGWVALRAQELFRAILPGNIVEVRVNAFRTGQPMSRPGGIITRREFTALAQGLLPQANIVTNVAEMRVAAGQQISIGKCSNEPAAELLAKLAAIFQKISEIQNAYLFEMINGGQKASVIGLQFASQPDADATKRVMIEIGNTLRGKIPRTAFVDFLPLAEGPLLDAARKYGKLIFKRQ